MSICGSLECPAIVFQTCMPSQRLTFPDEEFLWLYMTPGCLP